MDEEDEFYMSSELDYVERDNYILEIYQLFIDYNLTTGVPIGEFLTFDEINFIVKYLQRVN